VVSSVSVVVACRDRARLLEASLPALTSCLRAGDELVVVDAASSTRAVSDVAQAAGATVVRSLRPGASAARNAGWRAAQHDLVAFTDDDCRPEADWTAQLAEALGGLDALCGRVEADGTGHLSVLAGHLARDYVVSDDLATFGHGANLAVRRAALDAVSGWDERLGPGTRWAGAEDKDLVLRLLLSGHLVGYRPGPCVRHLQWRSRTASLRAELGYAMGAGALAQKGFGPRATRRAVAELASGARDLRHGYQYGAAAGVVRAGGVLWGAVTARRELS
jgi:glycosyltransferase involved in cell wall biosynthesis